MPDTLPTLELQQTWPRPSKPRAIVIVGAGGIVADAHLPAYRKAGFEVAGQAATGSGRNGGRNGV